VLNNQSSVDVFVASFSNCDTLFGSLTLSGSSITDISGLQFLTFIDGSLFLSSTSITDLAGLNNLEQINGTLNISSNRNLADISQLGQLETVGQDIVIFNNDALNSIEGLSNLNIVGDDISITSNNILEECTIICTWLENKLIGLDDLTLRSNALTCKSLDAVNGACRVNDIAPISVQLTTASCTDAAAPTLEVVLQNNGSKTQKRLAILI